MSLLGLAGGALGLAGSLFGQSQAQSSAREQMAFQREVMQNRYQWQTDDLKKAGLNPILATGLNAGGASGASVGPVNHGDAISKGFSAGSQASIAKRQLALQEKEVESRITANLATAAKETAQGKVFDSQVSSDLYGAQAGNYIASAGQSRATVGKLQSDVAVARQHIKESEARLGEIRANIETLRARASEARSSASRNSAEKALAEHRAGLVDTESETEYWRGRLIRAESEAAQLKIPGLKNQANFEKTEFGKWSPHIKAGGSLLDSATGTGRDMYELYRRVRGR